MNMTTHNLGLRIRGVEELLSQRTSSLCAVGKKWVETMGGKTSPCLRVTYRKSQRWFRTLSQRAANILKRVRWKMC